MKFAFPSILIVVAVLVFYFLTMPLLEKVTALSASNATIDEALQKSRELLKVRDEKLKLYTNFPSATQTKLEKLLPDHIDNVRLIIDLIALAQKFNLDLRNPQIKEVPKGAVGADFHPYDSVELSFQVKGNYETFQRFMAEVDRSLRLLDATSLSFAASDDDSYDFDVTLRTYWLK